MQEGTEVIIVVSGDTQRFEINNSVTLVFLTDRRGSTYKILLIYIDELKLHTFDIRNLSRAESQSPAQGCRQQQQPSPVEKFLPLEDDSNKTLRHFGVLYSEDFRQCVAVTRLRPQDKFTHVAVV